MEQNALLAFCHAKLSSIPKTPNNLSNSIRIDPYWYKYIFKRILYYRSQVNKGLSYWECLYTYLPTEMPFKHVDYCILIKQVSLISINNLFFTTYSFSKFPVKCLIGVLNFIFQYTDLQNLLVCKYNIPWAILYLKHGM